MNEKPDWEKVYFKRGLSIFLIFISLILVLTYVLRQETGIMNPANEGTYPHILVKEEEREPGRPLFEEKTFFIGLHEETRLAIYERSDNGGTILLELLPYLVKEVYYLELKKGIFFSTEEEKESILEYLTS